MGSADDGRDGDDVIGVGGVPHAKEEPEGDGCDEIHGRAQRRVPVPMQAVATPKRGDALRSMKFDRHRGVGWPGHRNTNTKEDVTRARLDARELEASGSSSALEP